MIHGLIDVDMTRVRQFLHEHQAKTGESLSFTAFIIACLAHAVDENKSFCVRTVRDKQRAVISL